MTEPRRRRPDPSPLDLPPVRDPKYAHLFLEPPALDNDDLNEETPDADH